LTCTGASGSSSDTVTVYVSGQPSVYVDLDVNGYDNSVTVSSGSYVTLSWTSSNANTCTASGDWSGARALSGSESIGPITSTRTYTLTCTGASGSSSDTVTVYVGSSPTTAFNIDYRVRNLSDGTVFGSSVDADPMEILTFSLDIMANNSPVNNLVARVTLPNGLVYLNDLKINNVPVSGDIITGLNLGNFSASEERTITFRARVAEASQFNLGQTQLTPTVVVSSDSGSRSAAVTVRVNRSQVLGAATDVSTGLTNNILIDSFVLPLLATLLILWLFRARIVNLEKWLDNKRKAYQAYKSDKALNERLTRLKIKEIVRS
ncbi:MAG: hypothetical protein ACPLW9_01395, partial [Minisyncoccales bacterium]